MTLIANPIYDSVFKYMMEDDRVAKILLSALLQKDIIDLQMKPHEYTEMMQTRISMLRIDFAATGTVFPSSPSTYWAISWAIWKSRSSM